MNLIFPSQNGLQPIDLRFPWEKALKAAAISNFKFHDLRHTAASFLLMSGAGLADVAAILGHKTLAMVKRYGYLSESHLSSAVLKMNQDILG